jgi:hypothetical protein
VRRREFITLIGGAAAWPLAARAQQAHGLIISARIAFLGAESASTNQHFFNAFRQGMREHGYVDGQNVSFVERWDARQTGHQLAGDLDVLREHLVVMDGDASDVAAGPLFTRSAGVLQRCVEQPVPTGELHCLAVERCCDHFREAQLRRVLCLILRERKVWNSERGHCKLLAGQFSCRLGPMATGCGSFESVHRRW